MKTDKLISVIIRVKNEERWVGHCIQSVLDIIDNPEIIIINNNSHDNSLNIINHFKRDKNLPNSRPKSYTDIKFLEIDEYTPGKALNRGVSVASNNYVLIISAHCVIQKFDSNLAIEELKDNSALFGNQIPIWNGKKINKKYIWSHFTNEQSINPFSELEGRYFFHNGFSFFKKNTLSKYPFDEELLSKEDRYWAKDMINNNQKIIYSPNFEVEHHFTENGATWKNM